MNEDESDVSIGENSGGEVTDEKPESIMSIGDERVELDEFDIGCDDAHTGCVS